MGNIKVNILEYSNGKSYGYGVYENLKSFLDSMGRDYQEQNLKYIPEKPDKNKRFLICEYFYNSSSIKKEIFRTDYHIFPEPLEIPSDVIQAAMDKAYSEAKHNAYFGNGFKRGVQFALEYLKEKNNES